MVRLQCYSTGESVELLRQINGTSGEGTVWTTSKVGFLAKIYHQPTHERIDKLRFMINNQPDDPTKLQGHTSIAWPKHILQDKYGQLLGFLMPEIKNSQTLINVYNPRLREKKAAGVNWYFLHVTAINIAYIVHSLHVKNYVIGDMKQQNLLVNSMGLVSIIDTDSFQIHDPVTGKVYRGHVGSGEYTPPEMFNVDFSQVDRSELQDRFGLAIIIWQLLFSSHPFAGQWIGAGNQPNIDKLIHQGDWIYGQSSNLRPTQLSIPLNAVHSQLENLFHKCFNDGCHRPYARPSALEWQESLKVAISNLAQCTKEAGHVYSQHYGKCYWCERKNQLGYDAFPSTKIRTLIPIPKPIPTTISKPIPTLIPKPQPKLVIDPTPTPKPVLKPIFRPTPFLAGLAIGAFALITGYYWLLIIAVILMRTSWSNQLS